MTWLTDVTEHPSAEGKLYLCAALRNAIVLRNPLGVIVHSDGGSPFRSASYRRLLRGYELTGSMGRGGRGATR